MNKRKKHNSLNARMQGKPQQTTLPGMEANAQREEKYLYLSELYSGQPYQRPVKDSDVNRLLREWDPRLLTPLVVSYRDGRYYLVDGQHRVCVLRQKNDGKDMTVLCQVYRGLTYEQEDVAASMGAKRSSEITFTSGGSESDNQAIVSVAELGSKKGKKHIISTKFEHYAVLHTLDKLEQQGFEITLLDPDRDGLICIEDVKAAIRDDTSLVSVMYANNEIGTVQPVAEIGAVCREKGVLFHTDAVQAVGHLHIDVEAQNIDLLSLSAHKFHGPKGVGALYARRGIALTPLIEGGGQEKGRRAGTENMMGIIGLAAALKDEVARIDKNIFYISALRDRIIDALLEVPNTVLNGDRTKRLAGNINVSFAGIEGESLLLLLDGKGIAASSGSACASSSLSPSHILLSIGVPEEVAHGSLRLSLSEYNTIDEAEYIIRAVKDAVSELRSISPI